MPCCAETCAVHGHAAGKAIDPLQPVARCFDGRPLRPLNLHRRGASCTAVPSARRWPNSARVGVAHASCWRLHHPPLRPAGQGISGCRWKSAQACYLTNPDPEFRWIRPAAPSRRRCCAHRCISLRCRARTGSVKHGRRREAGPFKRGSGEDEENVNWVAVPTLGAVITSACHAEAQEKRERSGCEPIDPSLHRPHPLRGFLSARLLCVPKQPSPCRSCALWDGTSMTASSTMRRRGRNVRDIRAARRAGIASRIA